ncbi:MAG: DUF3015 family protein [Anaeromyxobacter sp.]
MLRITLALAAAALLAAPFQASAADAVKDTENAIKGKGTYGTAGCGLGSMAFGNSPGAVQILAATTNGTFGTQTFGITSGTSNCGPALWAQGTKNFVEGNREAVAKDISRGQGEAIGALTVINNCSDSAAVGAALQKNFSAIYPTAQANDDQVTQAILQTLHSDASLGCGRG